MNFIFLYNLIFPERLVKFNKNIHKKEPWFSIGLLVSRREKLRLDSVASFTPTVQNIENFKNYKNLYQKLVRQAKRTYFEKQLTNNQSN